MASPGYADPHHSGRSATYSQSIKESSTPTEGQKRATLHLGKPTKIMGQAHDGATLNQAALLHQDGRHVGLTGRHPHGRWTPDRSGQLGPSGWEMRGAKAGNRATLFIHKPKITLIGARSVSASLGPAKNPASQLTPRNSLKNKAPPE